MLVGNFGKSSSGENILKYRIVHERWKKLYSAKNSLRLQDAVKKQVFKDYFQNCIYFIVELKHLRGIFVSDAFHDTQLTMSAF